MEIIDQEGQLFGVVNIIDALVVLLIGAVLVSGSVLVLGGTDADADAPNITANITVEGVQPYVAEAIEPGVVSEDMTISEKSVSPTRVTVADSEGNLHIREHPQLQTANLRVELRGERTSEGIQFRGRPLRVGSKITLDSGRVTATGNVTSIQE